MERFFDRVNAGDMGVIDEVLAEDMIEHEPIAPTPDREGVRQFFAMARAGFPDMRMTSSHMVEEGDLVMIHGLMEGTHRGEFMGIPATGREIAVPFADVCRFRDGLIAEHWGVLDSGLMMQQLGLAPPPGG
jgi:steroid delta-isomerase-like uncharacterized protein